MFCSSCGENCASEAKFCHKCGGRLQQNVAEGAGHVNECGGSASTASSGSSGASGLLTFKQFRARKEEDRSKHFRKKNPQKKMKLSHKGNVDCEVKINIGLMTMRDGRLSIKRGYSLPLSLTADITAEDLLAKAVEKHSRFHKDVIQSNNKVFYQLLYADKNPVRTLPGTDETFTLKRYKEEIDRPYSRITFYICPSSDYFDSVLGDLDVDLEESDLDSGLSESTPTNKGMQDQIQHIIPSSSLPDQNQVQEVSDSVEKELQRPVFEALPMMTPLTIDAPLQTEEVEQERMMSCPVCFSLHPIEQIEEHADNCSMWLLDDSNEQCDLPDPPTASSCNTEPVAVQQLTGHQQKKAIKEQIASLSGQLLSTDMKRLTVRRKFIWQDFKSAMLTRIQPKSTLKVVFSGEPAIDDGGPRRELFSGKIMTLYFTCKRYW